MTIILQPSNPLFPEISEKLDELARLHNPEACWELKDMRLSGARYDAIDRLEGEITRLMESATSFKVAVWDEAVGELDFSKF